MIVKSLSNIHRYSHHFSLGENMKFIYIAIYILIITSRTFSVTISKEEIISKIIEVYSHCDTYSDIGIVTSLIHSERGTRITHKPCQNGIYSR